MVWIATGESLMENENSPSHEERYRAIHLDIGEL